MVRVLEGDVAQQSVASRTTKTDREQHMNLLHAIFTRNLPMSGVAIVRYIPRAFRVKQVDGNLSFTEEKRQEYRRRVESVTPDSPRQWGTMEVDQMLHHQPSVRRLAGFL
jgi:hypothetical protein